MMAGGMLGPGLLGSRGARAAGYRAAGVLGPGDDRQSAQVEPDALDPDTGRHGQGGPGVAGGRTQQALTQYFFTAPITRVSVFELSSWNAPLNHMMRPVPELHPAGVLVIDIGAVGTSGQLQLPAQIGLQSGQAARGAPGNPG